MIYSEKIQQAVQFASQKHKNQKRKILDYPYITHSLMVFHLVSKFSTDEDLLCSAILHDTVEDTDASLSEIKNTFGQNVVYLVDILSEDKKLEYKERKEKYFDRIFNENNKDIFLIKSADILYNLIDMIETYNFGGKEEFSKIFINFSEFINSQKEISDRLKQPWLENPFLDDINFYINKLESLVQNGKLEQEISCGIIPVFKNSDGEYEYLVIRENSGHWSFPKGHIEGAETFIETSKRELLEETELVCKEIDEKNVLLEKFINKSRKPSTEKTVYYYIGFVNNKDIQIQTEEIQDFFWGSSQEVSKKITHNSTRNLLKETLNVLKYNT